MANIDIRVRITCDRAIEKGEVLDIYPDEVYAKSGGYGSSLCLMVEKTIHPILRVEELKKNTETDNG